MNGCSGERFRYSCASPNRHFLGHSFIAFSVVRIYSRVNAASLNARGSAQWLAGIFHARYEKIERGDLDYLYRVIPWCIGCLFGHTDTLMILLSIFRGSSMRTLWIHDIKYISTCSWIKHSKINDRSLYTQYPWILSLFVSLTAFKSQFRNSFSLFIRAFNGVER